VSQNRSDLLRRTLAERVLVLDGAMGTMIQAQDLTAADFGGDEYDGCNEYLNATRPDVVRDIHRAYLAAGADIIETNTFGSTALVLDEYRLGERAHELTAAAARIARAAAEQASTPDRPRFVAGSMGPTTKAISVTGGITFEELERQFHDQAAALVEGGVDYLLLETCQDTRNVKAGVLGVLRLFDEIGRTVPLAVSATIEPMGTMLAGQTAEALVTSLEHVDLLYLGLNCATGPEFMTDHIRALAELHKTSVACVPNAGLPDEDGHYLETPEMVTAVVDRFVEEGWLNLVGGCCGTGAEHVSALARCVRDRSPRRPPEYQRTFLSGIEHLELEESNRPILVGERTNVIGSRKFKKLVVAEQFEQGAEIARRQVKGGAQVIDICLANPDRDELEDTLRFLPFVVKMIKAPLMIDSTDAAVIAAALPYSQGKAVINSINLEDGLERFDAVVPLARRYGAALVVGCIDDDPQQGMAVTRERKLEVAHRSYELLVETYGVPPTDIIFDPLVFPCGTGDAQYLGSAVETIEGVRAISAALPLTKTILGISNVSFGLPAAGREVLNSVFLYHCTKAGLDMAIVNTEKLERYASIPDDERRLAEQILFETSDEAVAAFADKFRDARARVKPKATEMSLDERLANYILEGSKDGLIADLDLALSERKPLEVINGPLMSGMDEVGRLFNKNELIVAEVLQSAEAMKAAVSHLEPHMDKLDSASRGKVLLATVKGDVHDIGKNLVDIILSNNGFAVENLGIKVPPHELVEAVRQHRPDAIGLSGLLVKSAQMMVQTADELAKAGIDTPILVGGAALTRNFTRKRIAPVYPGTVVYAQDAMSGLGLAGRLLDQAARPALEAEIAAEAERLAGGAEPIVTATPRGSSRSARIRVLDRAELAPPPDLDRHVLRALELDEVWRWINPAMLYNRHLGFKGKWQTALDERDPKALELETIVADMMALCRDGRMLASATWRFFEAASEGNSLLLFESGAAEPATRFDLPRQAGDDGMCIADYVRPVGPAPRDAVALFVTTAGQGVRELARRWKHDGEYVRSHALQALALETAEAAAEWLHAKLRGQWGFPDPARSTMADRFQGRYRGRRYSFGYPACPDLADQDKLFGLLAPEVIDVRLTDGHMMDPEASVSALVVHHPDATYFTV